MASLDFTRNWIWLIHLDRKVSPTARFLTQGHPAGLLKARRPLPLPQPQQVPVLVHTPSQRNFLYSCSPIAFELMDLSRCAGNRVTMNGCAPAQQFQRHAKYESARAHSTEYGTALQLTQRRLRQLQQIVQLLSVELQVPLVT